jgi:hypothetical protein
VTAKAARSEADVDQTVATNFNSVLSNTKINTIRLTWTRENVTFGNQCYNDNGRDLSKCPPTLAFQTFTDQQDNTGQFRINDGIQFDETLGWFIPSGRGDHDLRIGGQYEYSGAFNRNDGNLNGTFSFGQNNTTSTRRTRAPTRIASASASAARASSSRRRTTPPGSCRTNGASTTS